LGPERSASYSLRSPNRPIRSGPNPALCPWSHQKEYVISAGAALAWRLAGSADLASEASYEDERLAAVARRTLPKNPTRQQKTARRPFFIGAAKASLIAAAFQLVDVWTIAG